VDRASRFTKGERLFQIFLFIHSVFINITALYFCCDIHIPHVGMNKIQPHDVTDLHCPLSWSQLASGAKTPGREQLHTSQPTTGWQPKLWGSHRVHSGRTVLGGQMQSPVTGSHRREPQLHAVGEGGGERRYINVSSMYGIK